MFTTGAYNGLWWYDGWPDSYPMVAAVRPQLQGATGRCLCEDYEVVEYYLDGVTTDQHITGPYYFTYIGAHGVRYTGKQAYKSAVQSGYFDVIELSSTSGSLGGYIRPLVEAQPQYQLIAKLPHTTSYGHGYYMVWKKVSP